MIFFELVSIKIILIPAPNWATLEKLLHAFSINLVVVVVVVFFNAACTYETCFPKQNTNICGVFDRCMHDTFTHAGLGPAVHFPACHS